MTPTKRSRSVLAFVVAVAGCLTSPAFAGPITIDMNGFPCMAGGHVNGTGLAAPIKIEPGQAKLVLDGLKPGGTYAIDFFHNSGENSSDFQFTLNAKGDGVESVTLGGGKHTMVTGFKPGDATLVLNTREIIFNANGAQTGPYYIQGLLAIHSLPPNLGPQKFKAIPGYYYVDVLYGSGGGTEDYSFTVDSAGNTSPGTTDSFNENREPQPGLDPREPATFAGNTVSPRAALVHFKIVAPNPQNFHVYAAATPAKTDGAITEFDEVMGIGATTVLFWSFGPNTVVRSNIITGFNKPLVWTKSENDMVFAPRLRYDLKKNQYYFETTKGPSDTALAEVSGTEDDKVTPLVGVEITATIIKGDATPASTQPGK